MQINMIATGCQVGDQKTQKSLQRKRGLQPEKNKCVIKTTASISLQGWGLETFASAKFILLKMVTMKHFKRSGTFTARSHPPS